MKKIIFKRTSLLVSLLMANTIVVSYSSKGAATTKELFDKYFELKPASNSLTKENYHQNKSANSKNNISSDQQLVGTWSNTSVKDSGEKYTNTIIYSPDGSFIRIITHDNGD